jgi:hypothetical protein
VSAPPLLCIVELILTYRKILLYAPDKMKGEGYLKTLDNFLLPRFYHWDNQEELHFVQDGTPPHFAFPLCA